MARARNAPAQGKAQEGKHLYAIGIGSNRPLSGRLTPRSIVQATILALDEPPLRCIAPSSIITCRPIGPSQRTYANAAALVESSLSPLAMLDALQAIERRFGRRRFRRWGARTLDLDLLLWSGGRVRHKRLVVPHSHLHARPFVLGPLATIAPGWRSPISSLSIRQLSKRIQRRPSAISRLVSQTTRPSIFSLPK
jgi:2-amino-4-hydroxy-6-hydroxymethyldihydropteridine diphosphokinase